MFFMGFMMMIRAVHIFYKNRRARDASYLLPNYIDVPEGVDIKVCEDLGGYMEYEVFQNNIVMSRDVVEDYYKGNIEEGSFIYMFYHEIGHYKTRSFLVLSTFFIFMFYPLGVSAILSFVDNSSIKSVLLVVFIIFVYNVSENYIVSVREMYADKYAKNKIGLEPIANYMSLWRHETSGLKELMFTSYPSPGERRRWLIDNYKDKEIIKKCEEESDMTYIESLDIYV